MTRPTVDDFVTYEQAIALRDLGYDEKGYFFFDTTFEEGGLPVVVHKGFVLTSTNSEMQNIGCTEVSAPTHNQAAKWLRGKKMSVEVEYNVGKDDWYCRVRDMHEGYNLYNKSGHKSYEAAFSDAISNAIKILTQNLHIR